METKAHIARRSSGLYEKLIRFYPHSYLSKHREELLQNFKDLERDLGSRRLLWAFIISDFIKSLGQQYMEYIKNHRWIQIVLAILAVLFIVCVWQFATLRIAHSSFDNYAAFRGCEHVTNQTDTSGTCTLANGQSITMVQYRGKWYLQGDLPPLCFGNFCL